MDRDRDMSQDFWDIAIWTRIMKKQRKKPAQKIKNKVAQGQGGPQQPERRDMLKRMRNWGIGAVVVAGAGYFSVNSVNATMAEHDLSRIGKGTPTVVQIHDPNCSLCQGLMREARAALKSFEDDQLLYLVANIKSDEGATLARIHNVPHVTLLLFNADGQLMRVMNGSQDRAVLKSAFEQHLSQG